MVTPAMTTENAKTSTTRGERAATTVVAAQSAVDIVNAMDGGALTLKDVSGLHRTAELLNPIFNNTHMQIVYLDTNFNFVRVNQAYAEASGHESAFFSGKNHFELYPHPENEAIFRTVRDTGKSVSSSDGHRGTGTPPCRITVEGNDDDAPQDDALRALLFQCASELTMNALKYAGRCEIRLVLSATDEHIQVQVQDTGRGFDPATLDDFESDHTDGGFGLFNIQGRLDGMGGDLVIDSAPGKGTTATVRIPLRTAP